MNPNLDDDLIALADQARRFATDRIAPGFQERDRTRVLDRGIMKEMGAMGFIERQTMTAKSCRSVWRNSRAASR